MRRAPTVCDNNAPLPCAAASRRNTDSSDDGAQVTCPETGRHVLRPPVRPSAIPSIHPSAVRTSAVRPFPLVRFSSPYVVPVLSPSGRPSVATGRCPGSHVGQHGAKLNPSFWSPPSPPVLNVEAGRGEQKKLKRVAMTSTLNMGGAGGRPQKLGLSFARGGGVIGARWGICVTQTQTHMSTATIWLKGSRPSRCQHLAQHGAPRGDEARSSNS